MKCRYPLCSRDATQGAICWPDWEREKRLRERRTGCDHCGAQAVLTRHLGRFQRDLCLRCAMRHRDHIEFLRSLPKVPLTEIEEQYAMEEQPWIR